MQFFIPFGDWSNDGHGRYETVLVEAPSMEHLLNAQIKIKEKYGQYFFSSFANDYGEAYVGEKVWQALIDTNYPIERFRETQDDIAWDKFNSIAEVVASAESEDFEDDKIFVTLETVKDAFIWLLNAFGAQIKVCEEHEKIPMICNWTCPGFEDVGYGCFYA
jgi:hypothetical protein